MTTTVSAASTSTVKRVTGVTVNGVTVKKVTRTMIMREAVRKIPALSSDAPALHRPGVPQRIMIPALDVDAPVIGVGLKPDRSMEIPGAREAGWYEPGPLPGETTGSAVIAGHVDHNKAPGVFLELRRLAIGDQIAIVDANGYRHGYLVSERFQVTKEQLPTGELFRRDGPPVLTLITCGGAFDNSKRSYDDNIVIRAIAVFSVPERNRAAADARTARLLTQTR